MALAALTFSRKYPGWHTYSRDRVTMKGIRWLASRGWIQVNRFGQFRAVQANGTAVGDHNDK